MIEQYSTSGSENHADSPIISGLDMRPTIEWYITQQEELLRRLPMAFDTTSPFNVEDAQFFSFTNNRIDSIISLFPLNALTRSRLQTGSIIGKPSLYFSNEATPENISTTDNPSEALSSTAIIPSFTDNTRWRETGKLSSDIWLFQIPQQVSPAVAEIIHTEGLIHEIAHTFVTQALFQDGYQLRLPDGNIVSAYDYLVEFANAAEKHDPVSHYSSFYRKSGEEFVSLPAIEEEFVETVTARLLGFVYCDNPDRRLDPLSDRPEIIAMVDDFLHAEVAE